MHSKTAHHSSVSWESVWLWSLPVFFSYNSDLGAAYGTAKAGTGISSISIWRPAVVMKSLIPVVMAGILGIYGMIVAVILSQKSNKLFNAVKKGEYNYHEGYKHMASGLVCGFSCVVFFLYNKGCWLYDRNRW